MRSICLCGVFASPPNHPRLTRLINHHFPSQLSRRRLLLALVHLPETVRSAVPKRTCKSLLPSRLFHVSRLRETLSSDTSRGSQRPCRVVFWRRISSAIHIHRAVVFANRVLSCSDSGAQLPAGAFVHHRWTVHTTRTGIGRVEERLGSFSPERSFEIVC